MVQRTLFRHAVSIGAMLAAMSAAAAQQAPVALDTVTVEESASDGSDSDVGEALLDIVAAVLGIGVVAGLRQLAVWRRSRPEHGRQSARP